MLKPFDLKRILKDRDALVARIELALALDRPQKLMVPPAPHDKPAVVDPSTATPPATKR